jgi:hypothetical protein
MKVLQPDPIVNFCQNSDRNLSISCVAYITTMNIASNGGTIVEWWTGKELEERDCGHCLDIWLEWLGKPSIRIFGVPTQIWTELTYLLRGLSP